MPKVGGIGTLELAEQAVSAAKLGAQSLARAHLTVATALVTGAITVMNYDTVDEDPDGAIATGAAWKFTCKRAGLYAITATAGINLTSAACTVFVTVSVNGTEAKRGDRHDILVGATATVTVATQIRLAVNDFVQIGMFQNSGAGQATETFGPINHFEATRVSA